VTQFAEAEGEKGAETRTWFSLPDEPVFAVAGIWRDTPEWGPAYSMVMTEACVHVAGVYDRPAAQQLEPLDRRASKGSARAVCAISGRDACLPDRRAMGAAIPRLRLGDMRTPVEQTACRIRAPRFRAILKPAHVGGSKVS
jgi:hypothetical protein